MKKFATILMLFAGIGLIVSCGKKASPEDEVRNYGKYFVEKVNANQIDSLTASYPDISKADSIAPLQSDTILVVEIAPGQYDLTLAEGITLKINRSEDGDITVEESRGLFVFPADKVEIAKKTGLANDSTSDKLMGEKIKDDDFFKYLDNDIKNSKSKLLTIKGGTVTNSSQKVIDGNDYKVIKRFVVAGNYFSKGGASFSSINGKTLQPGESMKIPLVQALMGMESLSGIKWQIPDEEVIVKYIPFTGNEYQEYLDSKK